MNQTELIVALQQGDEQAFKKLIDEWQSMVYNTALSIIQNEDEADEITQEVFIKVFQSISSFKGDAKISTWLYQITVNKSLDYLKKEKQKKRFGFVQFLWGSNNAEVAEPALFYHPGVAMEKKEASAALFKAIKKLPNNQRIAFTLHKVEGQKYNEIASIMNMSLQAIESLIARAKINLKKELEVFYKNNIV
ncbi:MAG: RNA polymerase sigma factor [Ferruginibacter sp.]|nr:RNA polymerase sigma factor [Ferruginibacter sp.]